MSSSSSSLVSSSSAHGINEMNGSMKVGLNLNKRKRAVFENPASSSSRNGFGGLSGVHDDAALAKALALSRAEVDKDIRRKQDEDYQMSVAMDRSKETQEAERKAQEEMALKQKAREEEEARRYEDRLQKTLEVEPSKGNFVVVLVGSSRDVVMGWRRCRTYYDQVGSTHGEVSSPLSTLR